MTYMLILGGWVMLWFSPRPRTLNAFGLILAIWMMLGAAIGGALVPETLIPSLTSWTLHMAAFLGVGAALMLWRRDEVAASADDQLMLPRGRLEPIFRKNFGTVLRYLLPVWAIGAILMLAVFLSQGFGLRAFPSALLFVVVLAAAPLAPLLIFWGIAALVDLINPNRK